MFQHEKARNAEELLHRDRYTTEELSELLEMDQYVIRRAIYSGELRANRVGDDIIDVDRSEVLRWLRAAHEA